MTALSKPDLSPAILASARRAADKLRRSMPAKTRAAAGTPASFKADTQAVLALLKLVDDVSARASHAPRKRIDEDEVTPNQAAEILKMSRPSVMRLVAQGALHPRMVHSRHKFARAEVVALAERQSRERRKALANLTELSEEYGF